MKSLTRIAALFATGFLLMAPAFAADRAIIILDASGSMWAKINGQSRIEIARQTLHQVLQGVPDNLEIGFMAYGHRSKGDCNDIQLLVPPAAGTAAAINTAAENIDPKGKTPLTEAVREAADALKSTEDHATVILITDGIETCNADPCALGTELKQSGVDLKVDVVGFGLSEDEGRQVACLADTTGGKYYQASDAKALGTALATTVAEVEAPPPTPAPAPNPQPAPKPIQPSHPINKAVSGIHQAEVIEIPGPEGATPSEQQIEKALPADITFAPTLTLSKGGPAYDDGSVMWTFYAVTPDGKEGNEINHYYGAPFTLALAPGNYLVRAALGQASLELPLTLAAGEVAKPEFNLNAGRLVLHPRPAKGLDVDGSTMVNMAYPGGETHQYGETTAILPAGDEVVTASLDAAKAQATIPLKAGQSFEADFIIGAGHVTQNASYTDGGDPVASDGIMFTVLSPTKKIDGSRDDFGHTYGAGSQRWLMPGEYVMGVAVDQVTTEVPFVVAEGAQTDFNAVLNAGVAVISAPVSKMIEIFETKKDIQGTHDVSLVHGYDPTLQTTLPAGDYKVVVTVDDAGHKTEAALHVNAGERNELTVGQ
ncbi:MAG: vWA domain-containing protein [Devosia sp.]